MHLLNALCIKFLLIVINIFENHISDQHRSVPGKGKIFSFKAYRLALEYKQLPIQGVKSEVGLYSRVKQPGLEAQQSPTSSVKVGPV
jgi:hypothetical protein